MRVAINAALKLNSLFFLDIDSAMLKICQQDDMTEFDMSMIVKRGERPFIATVNVQPGIELGTADSYMVGSSHHLPWLSSNSTRHLHRLPQMVCQPDFVYCSTADDI
jgi:hypothetical protein